MVRDLAVGGGVLVGMVEGGMGGGDGAYVSLPWVMGSLSMDGYCPFGLNRTECGRSTVEGFAGGLGVVFQMNAI